MLVLFCFSAALQVNDVDGFLWASIYLSGSLFCGLWHRDNLSARASLFACVCAFVSAAYLASFVPDSVKISEVLDWGMAGSGSEILRESGGLCLIAIWMALLSWWTD